MAHDFSFANIKMAWSGEIMLRIMATKDMHVCIAEQHKDDLSCGRNVQKGDLGGWVAESAEVEETAWISEDAEVFANAKVLGDSVIMGETKIFGDDVTVKSSILRDCVFSGEGVVENSKLTNCVVTDASDVHDAEIRNATIVNCDLAGSGYNGLQLCQTVAKSPADLVKDGEGGTRVYLSNLEIDPADILPEPEITPSPEPEPVPAEPESATVATDPVAKVQPAPRAKAEPKPLAAKKFVQKVTPLSEKLGQGELKFEPIAA